MQKSHLILGIHGLANKPPKEEKQGWWKAAILEGLRRNVSFAPAELPFDFVYWADIKNDTPLDETSNLEPYRAEDGDGPFPAHDPNASETEKLTLADRAYRAVEWVQERTGLAPIDEALIEYRLDDLYGYLGDAAFRAEARNRFREAIERHGEARLLVAAHSMGSLIAYDVLRMLDRDGSSIRVEHFLTLGAPMGLAEVRLKMEEEHGDLAVPDCVARWSNLMDRADVATFGDDIGDAYAPNRDGVRAIDVAVINAYRRPSGVENRHKSYGYLRTPEFSTAVRDFLTGDAEAEPRTNLADAAE